MRKFVFLFSFSTLFAVQIASADLIADWTFQTSASTNNIIGSGTTPGATQSGISADLGLGTASATHASSATAWSIPSGNGSTNSWSANTWSAGDFYQFSVSSAGFTNITLSYDQTGSATGPGKFALAYSLNGSSFTIFGVTNSLIVSTWTPGTVQSGFTFSYDLSSVTSLANQASPIFFQVIDEATTTGGAINAGNVGTGGTDRIDNFSVFGTSLSAAPEPTTLALVFGGAACLVAFRRRR
jgi:PEP-CTERM motif